MRSAERGRRAERWRRRSAEAGCDAVSRRQRRSGSLVATRLAGTWSPIRVALVNCLEQCPASHVVYVSSGAVYDGLRGGVSPATAGVAAAAIRDLEARIGAYVRFFAEHRGSVDSYVNVRFFGAYGPYEASRKITTRWLEAMAAGQRDFVVRGDGKNLIDFMYVDDAVDGFLALVKARGEKRTVDFASGSPISVDDVVRAMAAQPRRRRQHSLRGRSAGIHRVPVDRHRRCAIGSA